MNCYDKMITENYILKLLPASFEDICECPIIAHIFVSLSIGKTGNTGNIWGSVSQNWMR